MPVFSVKVKWGKTKYDDIELSTDEPPSTFKSQLFSITGVPLERQKLMIAGQTVGDDLWTEGVLKKLKPNCMLMLMGSADQLPAAPPEKTKFIEDMSESEAAKALDVPFGLRNFGNTCYMNASIQCIRAIPELQAEIKKFSIHNIPPTVGETPQHLTTNLNVLFKSLERNEPDMLLLFFMESLHKAIPHFGQKDESSGAFQQQDAHECWSALISNLNISLVPKEGNDRSFIQKFLGIQYQHSYKCLESDEEMETVENEDSFQISCFIEQEVKYLHTGIAKGLKGTIEKHSSTLARDASYQKVSTVTRLPAYLTVQFVRFFHGRVGQSDDFVAKKILKDVKFPLKFDMFEFCSSDLQDKLLPIRRKYKEVEDQKMLLHAKKITEGPSAKGAKTETTSYEPFSFSEDPGSNNSGYYDLIAVLTHQGRSSSSGHYVAWIKRTNDQWFKFDDDDVSLVSDEEIKKLSGGGDWHTAYILIYGPKLLESLEPSSV